MKKEMSKYVALLLVAAMTADPLANYSGGQSTPTGTMAAEAETEDIKAEEPAGGTGAAKTEEDTDDRVEIAFTPQLIGISYFSAMENGGRKAAKDLGVELLYTESAQASTAEQVKIVDSLIGQRVNAISLSVLDSPSTNPCTKKTQEAGIKVYTSGSNAPDSTKDFYVVQALDKGSGIISMDCLGEQMGGDSRTGIVSDKSTVTNLNTWIDYIK